METKVYLSVQDLMKLLPLKRSHVYSLIQSKKVPFYKIGGRYMFEKTEIENWIELSKNATTN
jgi:excisionase family DNA binding protein